MQSLFLSAIVINAHAYNFCMSIYECELVDNAFVNYQLRQISHGHPLRKFDEPLESNEDTSRYVGMRSFRTAASASR